MAFLDWVNRMRGKDSASSQGSQSSQGSPRPRQPQRPQGPQGPQGPDEERRLWKKPCMPLRKILLWGWDPQHNPCLLILYGVHEAARTIKKSYYDKEYILKPEVLYTHYAVFHGVSGHLPSIPNTYFNNEGDGLLCYRRGYNKANTGWNWDSRAREYRRYFNVDQKYMVQDFYKLKQPVEFDYFQELDYKDYVAYLKANHVSFMNFTLLEEPSELFGFAPDSPYYNLIIQMFSNPRVYGRQKYLKQFMQMQPSVEEYRRLLQVASVELACGIFQQLLAAQSPILLEDAIKIAESSQLWADEAYHNGLIRCARQYINLFDEQMLRRQKDLLYKNLPAMDFQIKSLKLKGGTLTGKELDEYLSEPNAYLRLTDPYYGYGVYGEQKLYKNNPYLPNGKDLDNVKFKNTIQTAKAYGMADAIGKIAYYLDAPRTVSYLKGSGRAKAYTYYMRYLRRTLDGYLADDEEKFVQAAREMLSSYTDQDNLSWWADVEANALFARYFGSREPEKLPEVKAVLDRRLDDVIYIAKNAKVEPVHELCYDLLKKANGEGRLASFTIKELILLAQIPYEKTAVLFRNKLKEQLDEVQEFSPEIMLALMNARDEVLQNVAKKYFARTNGKFSPEDVAKFFTLDTIDTWDIILINNINTFTPQENVAFIKALAELGEYFVQNRRELPEQIAGLLPNSVKKLQEADLEAKQDLLRHFINLLLNNREMPDFLEDMAENIIFLLPYQELQSALQSINLHYTRISARKYNAVILLKAVKKGELPKDSVITSILETGSAHLVKMLTEVTEKLQGELPERAATLLLLFECNVFALNQIAQNVFEAMEPAAREKQHLLLLDSPVEKVYQYGLQKLDDWYGGKTPQLFITRMLEHPCVPVKAYIAGKIREAFTNLQEVQPDLYVYYAKTLLYLPNRVSKSKENIYKTMPAFISYYPDKQQEIEHILLDIGSTSNKINSERALVAFAQIRKEVCSL